MRGYSGVVGWGLMEGIQDVVACGAAAHLGQVEPNLLRESVKCDGGERMSDKEAWVARKWIHGA
jgi:hypothetical protein